MHSHDLRWHHAARLLVVAAAALLAALGITPAPRADATTFGLRAVSISAAQKGKPYKWGAVGPTAFDCSGLIVYVYDTRLHKHLPRTASAQRRATIRIPKSQVRPGDLIFLHKGTASNVTHVGVYAGAGRIWHSPHAGDHVKLSTLWTTQWTAGRVP